MSDTPTTPAGWYDDGSGRQRYWDGAGWTEHYQNPPTDAAQAPASPDVPAAATSPGAASRPLATATLAPPTTTAGAAAVAASTSEADRKPGILGLVALGVAVVGFIFACIPGALILGWVLLPIAFVLAIVAFFLKGRKWPAITALILSVVGTIVAIVVFFAVVSVAFTEAFGDDDTSVAPPAGGSDTSESAAPTEDAADEGAAVGTRDNPAPIGSTVTGDEYTVVVNSVALDANDQVLAANQFNEPPAEGLSYMVVNATITYTGEDSGYALFAQIDFVATSGEVYGSSDTLAVAPDPTLGLDELFTGGASTGNIVIAIPAGADGAVRVTPGILADDVFVSVR